MDDLARQFRDQDRSFLRLLAKACRDAGGRALLVGGCVRSALLRERPVDFDVEVFGIPSNRLEKILRRQGSVTRVGKAFGIYKFTNRPVDVGLPRSEWKSGTGHCGFEVRVDPFMSLEQAARRRDFTVNALYFDPLTDTVEDPLGGLEDLQDGILRHCSERFSEDPLRVLRAMQFAARLPARVSPATLELCRSLTPEGLSAERYFAEWEKLILEGKRPSAGLRFLKESGWLGYFPELEAMVGCRQEPDWHPEGDVWDHTLHCMDAFARDRTGDRVEDLVVGLAVLCHDLGKPETTRVINGRICSHGHENAGLRPAESFLVRLKVSRRLIDQILPLIRCHMRPAVLYRDRSSAAAVRRLARDCGRLDRLLRVFRADAAGRPPLPDNSAPATRWISGEARRLDVEKSGPRPLLGGHDLMERGLPEGPQLGKILRQAYEAQLDGAFESRRAALEWLDSLIAGNS